MFVVEIQNRQTLIAVLNFLSCRQHAQARIRLPYALGYQSTFSGQCKLSSLIIAPSPIFKTMPSNMHWYPRLYRLNILSYML